ncbi:minichromosome maintenance complex component 4 [Homo sapiens]|uniref:Minichromosome maintenance complex component 4 n=1 Tax=Homo sapiens TaxID=9606 RepID=A0A3B3IS88_HUMAN|nr:minichromosome maintenance complex component 4 [Homo sapiens]KAI4010568.1 minichromosome maintenance complex component 4 [Homo sapiens]
MSSPASTPSRRGSRRGRATPAQTRESPEPGPLQPPAPPRLPSRRSWQRWVGARDPGAQPRAGRCRLVRTDTHSRLWPGCCLIRLPFASVWFGSVLGVRMPGHLPLRDVEARIPPPRGSCSRCQPRLEWTCRALLRRTCCFPALPKCILQLSLLTLMLVHH